MRSYALILIAAAAVALATLPATAENGEYRIGVVNVKEVFDSYERQEDEYEKLRKKKDELQVPLDKLSAEISEAKTRYDEERNTMPEEERIALADRLESMLSEYELQFKRAQEEIDRREKRLIREVFEDINTAVQEVGAKYNYHLVFEGSEGAAAAPGRTGGLLYFSTTLNMTHRVIEHLNTAYKAE